MIFREMFLICVKCLGIVFKQFNYSKVYKFNPVNGIPSQRSVAGTSNVTRETPGSHLVDN